MYSIIAARDWIACEGLLLAVRQLDTVNPLCFRFSLCAFRRASPFTSEVNSTSARMDRVLQQMLRTPCCADAGSNTGFVLPTVTFSSALTGCGDGGLYVWRMCLCCLCMFVHMCLWSRVVCVSVSYVHVCTYACGLVSLSLYIYMIRCARGVESDTVYISITEHTHVTNKSP